ncbi:MAG TPA: hypothetical protein VGC79_04495, partial [Polyangiaceae bacterium]
PAQGVCYAHHSMRGWFRDRQTLLGAAAFSALLIGCASQHDDSLRLSEELGRARADSAWQRVRAAELESRISQLEQRAGTVLNAQRGEDRVLVNRLDRLLEMNERLLAARAAAAIPAGAAPSGPSAPAAAPPAATKTAVSSAAPLSDEQALRALVQRLRGRPGRAHGGLTREQENALRVLTQPERELDTENPWPAAFY